MNSQDLIYNTNTESAGWEGGEECQESICFTQGGVYKQLIYIRLVHMMESVKLLEEVKVTSNQIWH